MRTTRSTPATIHEVEVFDVAEEVSCEEVSREAVDVEKRRWRPEQ